MLNLLTQLATIDVGPMRVFLWIMSIFTLANSLIKSFPLRWEKGSQKKRETSLGKSSKGKRFWLSLLNTSIGISLLLIGILLVTISSFIIINQIEIPNCQEHTYYIFVLLSLLVTLMGYGIIRHDSRARELLCGGMLAMISSMIFWWPKAILKSNTDIISLATIFIIGELLIGLYTSIIQLMRNPVLQNIYIVNKSRGNRES